MTTPFAYKCKVLGEFWSERNNPAYELYFETYEATCFLGWLIDNKWVHTYNEVLVETDIEEAWAELLWAFDVEDIGFESMAQVWGTSKNKVLK